MGDIVILLLIGVAMTAGIRKLIKHYKSGCDCGCGSGEACRHCHPDREKKDTGIDRN